jgi:hypothetical protein
MWSVLFWRRTNSSKVTGRFNRMPAGQLLRKCWDMLLAVAAGICGGLWLTAAVVNSITAEAIAFFTIQAAAIFPAMIFTAGLLRGQGLSMLEIDRYQAALRRQMHFWVTLLCLDIAAVFFLIIGKAANWRWNVSVEGHGTDLAWVLAFVVVFVSTLAILRMIPFVRGVMSLLELNGALVKKAAEEALASPPNRKAAATPDGIDLPPGYGRILPHPRKRRRTGE